MTNREWLINEICKENIPEEIIDALHAVCNEFKEFTLTRCLQYGTCTSCISEWLKDERTKSNANEILSK